MKIRNKFTHHQCSYTAEEMEVKFAGMFAFMMYFYEVHLKVSKEEIITNEQYIEIFSLKTAKEELLIKVKLILEERNVGQVWDCKECFEETFIVEDAECRLCGHKEEVVMCPKCEEEFLSDELVDITRHFDYDDDEGLYRLINDYGFDFTKACVDCENKIKEKIRNEQYAQYCEDMEMEHYYKTRA